VGIIAAQQTILEKTMLDLTLWTPLYSGLAVLPISVPHPDCVVDLGASDMPNPPPRLTVQTDVVVYVTGSEMPNPPPRK
jgi:hypothetical protein